MLLKAFKLLLVFVLASTFCCAQQQMIDLAKEYYKQADYAKAVETFKNIYANNATNTELLDLYAKALLQLKDYKNAEKIIKQSIKVDNTLQAQFMLAQLYTLQGNNKKADKLYTQIIEDNTTAPDVCRKCAQLFIENKMIDNAVLVYETAQTKSKNPFLFAQELADIYNKQGNFEKATEHLLNILDIFEFRAEEVKTGLLRIFTEPANVDVVRKKIIKRIQTQPEKPVFPEMLSWLYIQKGDYESAFEQIKALDVRLTEGGKRPIEFARVAQSEKQYAMAQTAYNYVLNEVDKKSPYYNVAQLEILNCMLAQVQNEPQNTKAHIDSVTTAFENYLNQNEQAKYTSTQHNYATLLAQYANNTPKAISALKVLVNAPQTNTILKAKCKLDLGDYYVIEGDNWEATLLYSQVDKDFKNDMLAEDARFRNAKLSYYMADYTWAQAQLDVLKASTSELIANDAMDLSVLITENIPADSNLIPIQTYSRAELLVFQNKFDEAVRTLDTIVKLYPEHPLQDNILMTKANIAFKQKDYKSALEFYNKVYTKHGQDILADDALYKMANIEETFLHNNDEAKNLYEKIILEYPSSTFVNPARKAFRRLRGDVLEVN